MTDRFLREVGRVMVNLARLEWNLAFAISGLIGPYTAGGQMIALELPFKKKRILFQCLCQHELTPSSRKASADLKMLLQRLLECESSARQVTHPIWLAAPHGRRGGGAIQSRMTAVESKRPRDVRAPDVARLKTVANEIGKVADAIGPFLRRHAKGTRGQELPPRRPTMKLTKLSAAWLHEWTCRLMPAPAGLHAGTASQLIPGVRPTVGEQHEEAAPGVATARRVTRSDGAAAAPQGAS